LGRDLHEVAVTLPNRCDLVACVTRALGCEVPGGGSSQGKAALQGPELGQWPGQWPGLRALVMPHKLEIQRADAVRSLEFELLSWVCL
jgi:hypothetical protein